MLPDRHGADLLDRVFRSYQAPTGRYSICEPCWLHPSPRAVAMDRPDIDINVAGHPLCPHGSER